MSADTCAYCGLAEGHSKRCSVTKGLAGECRVFRTPTDSVCPTCGAPKYPAEPSCSCPAAPRTNDAWPEPGLWERCAVCGGYAKDCARVLAGHRTAKAVQSHENSSDDSMSEPEACQPDRLCWRAQELIAEAFGVTEGIVEGKTCGNAIDRLRELHLGQRKVARPAGIDTVLAVQAAGASLGEPVQRQVLSKSWTVDDEDLARAVAVEMGFDPDEEDETDLANIKTIARALAAVRNEAIVEERRRALQVGQPVPCSETPSPEAAAIRLEAEAFLRGVQHERAEIVEWLRGQAADARALPVGLRCMNPAVLDVVAEHLERGEHTAPDEKSTEGERK